MLEIDVAVLQLLPETDPIGPGDVQLAAVTIFPRCCCDIYTCSRTCLNTVCGPV